MKIHKHITISKENSDFIKQECLNLSKIINQHLNEMRDGWKIKISTSKKSLKE